jgi:hypothetical protein
MKIQMYSIIFNANPDKSGLIHFIPYNPGPLSYSLTIFVMMVKISSALGLLK